MNELILNAKSVAEAWEFWYGENKWSKLLREFDILRGRIIWHCGYPRSKSAIPLSFSLYEIDEKGNNHYIPRSGLPNMKYLKYAIQYLGDK